MWALMLEAGAQNMESVVRTGGGWCMHLNKE